MAAINFKFASAFRAVTGRDATKAIEWRGERWLVGDDALREARLINELWATDDLVKYYPLFVEAVRDRTGTKPDAILLPLIDWYYSTEGLANYTADLQRAIGNGIKVLPQGITGLYRAKETGEITGPTLVVDGGFRTVNLATVVGDDVVAARTHHDEIGIRNLIRGDFRESLASKFPDITHNLVTLNRVWQDGFIDTGLKTTSVEEEKRTAISRFIDRFMNILRRDVTEMGVHFDAILFLGGLAYYIDPHDIDTNKRIILPQESAEFYNSTGALEYANANCVLDLGFGDAKVSIKEAYAEEIGLQHGATDSSKRASS